MANLRMCELESDNGRGFNGKAHVVYDYDDRTQTLFSYCTPVLRFDASDGTYHRIWDGWSATTGRHIKAYSGLDKAGYLALPYEG